MLSKYEKTNVGFENNGRCRVRPLMKNISNVAADLFNVLFLDVFL